MAAEITFLKEKLEEIIDQLKDLNDRLFKDNGNPSLQSKVNKNSDRIGTMTKMFVIALTGFCLPVSVYLIREVIKAIMSTT